MLKMGCSILWALARVSASRVSRGRTYPRSEPGSSSRQRLDYNRRQSRRHRSRDPHTGVTSEFDLDRRRRRYGNAITSRRHQHLSEAIRRGPRIPPPTIDQTRRYVGLARHVPHHCTRPECRRYDRLLLLDAPPATSLRTGQNLDTCHPTVSRTGANTGVCTTAQSRHIKPPDGRRPAPEGYDACGVPAGVLAANAGAHRIPALRQTESLAARG